MSLSLILSVMRIKSVGAIAQVRCLLKLFLNYNSQFATLFTVFLELLKTVMIRLGVVF